MNYYQHLVKLNNVRYGGSRLSLLRLVLLYNTTYFFWRPFLVKLLRRGKYRAEKKLFYTVLTGGYDQLNEIPEKLANWDYVCYTDNEGLTSKSWEIRLLPRGTELDPIRRSRELKINNHLVDEGYDLSVYVDANLRIRGDLDGFLAHAMPSGCCCAMLFHPFLNSLGEEVEQCILTGKDDAELIRNQYAYYTGDRGFDDRYPHVNARMIIRRSGREAIRRVMETWYSQLLQWSRRDQLSFNYALSCCPELTVDYIPYWIFRRYFKRIDHR